MSRFSIDSILKATGGALKGGGGMEITGVSTDTRAISPGDLFFALSGPNFDGADFAAKAIESGAGGVVVSKGSVVRKALKASSTGAVLIEVDDTLCALQALARFHRQALAPRVIGVTGTNGKTTTKEMIASILALGCPVLKTVGNLNNEIGLPLTLLRLQPEQKMAVVEMGMSDLGEIKLLADISMPNIGVITNVGPAHLQTLGSVEMVARAKVELLEGLDKNGAGVINGDDDILVKTASAFKGRMITFGLRESCDVRASDIILDHRGCPTFILHYKGEAISIKLSLTGRHNVYNALAAASAAVSVGTPLSQVKQGLEAAEGVSMRMEVRNVAGRRLIVDCYNANPASMKAALETLAGVHGRKWAVLGDMLELGALAETAHVETGRQAADAGLQGVILLGEFSRLTAQGAIEGGMNESVVARCADQEEAAHLLMQWSLEGDTVLLKGSRGARLEKVIEAMTQVNQETTP